MSQPIRHSVRLRCPPAHAFAVFTGAIDAWWPASHRGRPDATIAFETGASARLVERDPQGGVRELGQVIAWEPAERLAYTWRPGAPEGLTTRVEVRFLPDGDGTRVNVTHSDGEPGLGADWATRAQRFDASWPVVLRALEQHVAT
ncbi:MAG: SRPBCC domain-containing protein [Myxococcota bacterium]